MRGASKPTKAVQMACITIGFEDYLMPADKAMKVAELMQHAFHCRKDFSSHATEYYFVPKDQPRVEFVFVKPQQLRPAAAEPAPRLLLGAGS